MVQITLFYTLKLILSCWIPCWTSNEVSHLRKPSSSKQLQQQNPCYLRYTEHSLRSPNTPVWIRQEHFCTYTHIYLTHSCNSHPHPPHLFFFDHRLLFSHNWEISTERQSSIFITINLHTSFIQSRLHSTPPLRPVRLVRKQLIELSSAEKHHHLLYPLSDDSLGMVNPCIHAHTCKHFAHDSRVKPSVALRVIWSSNPNMGGWKLWRHIIF